MLNRHGHLFYIRNGKNILASCKKIKNHSTSVAVVKKIDEAKAGSRCTAFKATGIKKPNIPDMMRLPTIAIQIIIPRYRLP